ncbi:hypothetical protein FRC02_000572 [Tulasnella sp. 418]|nr:hypothetical protein FRC02_000572 [Tulasnella sp. 418]
MPNPPSSFFGKSENRPKEDKKPWDKSGPSTSKQIFPSKKEEGRIRYGSGCTEG